MSVWSRVIMLEAVRSTNILHSFFYYFGKYNQNAIFPAKKKTKKPNNNYLILSSIYSIYKYPWLSHDFFFSTFFFRNVQGKQKPDIKVVKTNFIQWLLKVGERSELHLICKEVTGHFQGRVGVVGRAGLTWKITKGGYCNCDSASGVY